MLFFATQNSSLKGYDLTYQGQVTQVTEPWSDTYLGFTVSTTLGAYADVGPAAPTGYPDLDDHAFVLASHTGCCFLVCPD